MKSYQLEDKVLVYLLKCYTNDKYFLNSRFADIVKSHSDYSEEQLIVAVDKLKSDGFLELMNYNSKPGSVFLKFSALNQMNEDDFTSKGYNSYNELMDIIRSQKMKGK